MRVPKRLERATECRAGGALQNVVTTDEYIARDMIAHLRQKSWGARLSCRMTTISAGRSARRWSGRLTMPGLRGRGQRADRV